MSYQKSPISIQAFLGMFDLDKKAEKPPDFGLHHQARTAALSNIFRERVTEVGWDWSIGNGW
jgi:hypothetical protein